MATTTLTPEVRNQVILGAVQAAGPMGDDAQAWEDNVKSAARRLAVMLGDESPVSKVINAISGSKKFVGTVEGVLKEASSTRAFVGIKSASGPGKYNKSGYESARTDRTDSNEEGRQLANRINKQLIGHRVLFFVEMQEGKDETKYRTLVHVEDLGLDSEWPNPETDPEGYAARRAEGKEITKDIQAKKL